MHGGPGGAGSGDLLLPDEVVGDHAAQGVADDDGGGVVAERLDDEILHLGGEGGVIEVEPDLSQASDQLADGAVGGTPVVDHGAAGDAARPQLRRPEGGHIQLFGDGPLLWGQEIVQSLDDEGFLVGGEGGGVVREEVRRAQPVRAPCQQRGPVRNLQRGRQPRVGAHRVRPVQGGDAAVQCLAPVFDQLALRRTALLDAVHSHDMLLFHPAPHLLCTRRWPTGPLRRHIRGAHSTVGGTAPSCRRGTRLVLGSLLGALVRSLIYTPVAFPCHSR